MMEAMQCSGGIQCDAKQIVNQSVVLLVAMVIELKILSCYRIDT